MRNRGWYISRFFGEEEFSLHGMQENILAWCPSRKGEPQTFPQECHIPYNVSYPEVLIAIKAYSGWLENALENEIEKTAEMHNEIGNTVALGDTAPDSSTRADGSVGGPKVRWSYTPVIHSSHDNTAA